jgi:hypothetical protein
MAIFALVTLAVLLWMGWHLGRLGPGAIGAIVGGLALAGLVLAAVSEIAANLWFALVAFVAATLVVVVFGKDLVVRR